MQECTKPAALARTSTLRGCFGLTGAVSGKAAIIFSTSAGLGGRVCARGPAPGGGGGLVGLEGKGAGAQGSGANTNQQRSCRVFETHGTSRVNRSSYQCLPGRGGPGMLPTPKLRR